MPTPAKKVSGRPDHRSGGAGIFGPNWHRWRGALLQISLDNEPPLLARLEAVSNGRASLMRVEPGGRAIGPLELPWPPQGGSVKVVRTP